jgi:hypothetical protein
MISEIHGTEIEVFAPPAGARQADALTTKP